jgi:hypothetical protein
MISLKSNVRGRPTELEVAAFKSYFDDPYYKAMPYSQARAAISNDRRLVIADTQFVELTWGDGSRQSVPLAFPGQRGLSFVISGEPDIGTRLPVAASVIISLNNNSEVLDVKIPDMTISGCRLELPVVHFRRTLR